MTGRELAKKHEAELVALYKTGMPIRKVRAQLVKQGASIPEREIRVVLDENGLPRRMRPGGKAIELNKGRTWPERLDFYEKKFGNHIDAINQVLLEFAPPGQTSDTSAYSPAMKERSMNFKHLRKG